MANDITQDSSIVAAWLFAAGFLTADSKSTNTLTDHGTCASSTAIQGAATIGLNGSSKYMEIADASLAAGFPFKNGDTGKKITVALKFRVGASVECPLAGKLIFGSTGCFGLTFNLGYFFQYNGTYTNSQFAGLPTLVVGDEYQIIYAVDGVNKVVRIYAYNYTTGAAYYYGAYGSWATALAGSTLAFRIGYDSARTAFANGDMGEVLVFNRIINLAEMQAIKNNTYSTPIYPLPVSLYRFENGALATDSKNNNNLTSTTPPSVDLVNYKEGLASANFIKANSQYYTKADADLSMGFPFKNGTANYQMTLAFWIKWGANIGGGGNNEFIISKWDNTFVLYHRWYGDLVVNVGGTASQVAVLTAGNWYHIGVTITGKGCVVKVRLWDDTNQSVSSYYYSYNGTIPLTTAPLLMAFDNGTIYSNQGLDQVAIFGDILSDADIDSIRAGTYNFGLTTVRDLSSTCAIISSVSSPLLVVTRPLAVFSGCPERREHPTPEDHSGFTEYSGDESAVSAPLLAILRNLIDFCGSFKRHRVSCHLWWLLVWRWLHLWGNAGRTLLVKRDLATAVAALSATTAPNLLVQRNLAAMAAILSETSDITLLTAAIVT